jgi:hypothetical protein
VQAVEHILNIPKKDSDVYFITAYQSPALIMLLAVMDVGKNEGTYMPTSQMMSWQMADDSSSAST